MSFFYLIFYLQSSWARFHDFWHYWYYLLENLQSYFPVKYLTADANRCWSLLPDVWKDCPHSSVPHLTDDWAVLLAPSMAWTEPFDCATFRVHARFAWSQRIGWKFVHCHGALNSSAVTTNIPSPCETGIAWTPTCTPANHGELVLATEFLPSWPRVD